MKFIKLENDRGISSYYNPMFITSVKEGLTLTQVNIYGLDYPLYYKGSYEELVKESKGE
jgi:hypothetical protein